MQYFWCSSESIPKGLGFSHFDDTHLFWLGLFLAVITACILHYRHLGTKGRSIWRKVVACLLVADELWKQIGLIAGGNWDPSYLPLHLCSINIFLIVYHSLRPGKLVGNFLYTVGIPGAVAALLFPTWTKLPMLNFMHIHSCTVHILLALYPIVLTAAGDIRPDCRLLPKCLLLLGGMAALVAIINPIADANFFFLDHASKGNPLYFFQEAFGSHLIGFPVIIAGVLLVMHTPWVIAKKLKKA